MALALALVYGLFIFFTGYVVACCRTHFTKWFVYHQGVALWSQLLFGFAFVVACVLRRSDESLQAYEGLML